MPPLSEPQRASGATDLTAAITRARALMSTFRRFALIAVVSLGGVPTVTFGQRRDDDSAAHIAHIENGLLPSVVVRGVPPATMTLGGRMRHYHVPAVSIAFFDRGRVAWTRAYGLADVATGRQATPETLFQAGSISKPIAALGALKLVEQGKLALDENVNGKLTSWKLPENEFTKQRPVTLRRILSHSAGLTVHGFPGYAAGDALPTTRQILDGEPPANSPPVRVDTVPGTRLRYSGGGTVVMQLMMTDVTGAAFPQLMHDLVLGPIGMSHSTYEQPLPPPLRPNAAAAYDERGDPIDGGFHTYPEMAAGGLWTTPSDLARAAVEVQRAYAGTSSAVLSRPAAHEMLTPQIENWGLGWELSKTGDAPRFDHYGVNRGFVSVLQAYRDMGQGIVVMTNGTQGEPLINEILRSVAREYDWPNFRPDEHTLAKIDPASLPSFTGTYVLRNPDGDDKLTVTVRQSRLYLSGSYTVGSTYHFGLPEPVELLPEGPSQFFTLSTGATVFRFEKSARNVAEACVVVSRGTERRAEKIAAR